MPRPLPASVAAITDGDVDAVRNHIMRAAHQVIANRGLAMASTRAIAEEAGLASGTLYNYFGNRQQLLAKAIVWHAAGLIAGIDDLPLRAGHDTVVGNLRLFAHQAAVVLDQLVPVFAAAFSDSGLLGAMRRELVDMHLVDRPAGAVEQYLLAERGLGRVRPDADCRAAAAVMASLCHDRAFQRYLLGASGESSVPDQEIGLLVRSLASQQSPAPAGISRKGHGHER
jgi:AcrR family transcriptional regulator